MKPVAMFACLIVLIFTLQNAHCACPYAHPYPYDLCGPNEEFQECGTACPKTCADLNDPPKACTLQCVQGCFCKPGFVRESLHGKCVPECECPSEKCGGDNEHYLTCGPVQQPTCDNPSVENDLIGCAQGCFCKPDYIRHAEGGICMKPVAMFACLIVLIFTLQNAHCACPYAHPYPYDLCGPNEEFQECGTACPKTCADLNDPPKACTLQCVQGCFCKPGFVRESLHGQCIPECECPCRVFTRALNVNQLLTMKSVTVLFAFTMLILVVTNVIAEDTCEDANEQFLECGPVYQLTCDSLYEKDTANCTQGCFCKPNYIRSSEGGPCIPTNNCPHYSNNMKPVAMFTCLIVLIFTLQNAHCACRYAHPYPYDLCGPNEEFQECGTACPKTCADLNDPPKACTLQCVQGCFCKPGFVRESLHGKCIPECECPSAIRIFTRALNVNLLLTMKSTTVLLAFALLILGVAIVNAIESFYIEHSVTTAVQHLFQSNNMKPVAMFACLIVLIFTLQNAHCACPYAHPYPYDVCGPNEEFQTCGTACPNTCADLSEQQKPCTKQCVQGCFCKPGFVRESKEGKCIPKCECPCH
ncbi:zonadhesin-like [Anopheles merus]|nr:zonadhesin-like [Anopheles merus]